VVLMNAIAFGTKRSFHGFLRCVTTSATSRRSIAGGTSGRL